jgi:hypothetical protein
MILSAADEVSRFEPDVLIINVKSQETSSVFSCFFCHSSLFHIDTE